jgi:carotenoid cleavage dioxygenase-like enzyme
VVLKVMLDPNVGQPFLLICNAATLCELAHAEVPHHIPFVFHGTFIRTVRADAISCS